VSLQLILPNHFRNMSLADEVAKTQAILSRVVKKTPLQEKLLSKPPFRYLHDVVSEVIRKTGFAKDLFSEAEMDSSKVTVCTLVGGMHHEPICLMVIHHRTRIPR
jgi:hypothetical protein